MIGARDVSLISLGACANARYEYNITGRVFDESYQGVERVRVCAITRGLHKSAPGSVRPV